MRNTVLHIQAKVHPVIASIALKFRGMKEDIDISKRWTSHFLISYRFRDICLDCRSFINISDWMVQKIIFTEAIIHKWSSLSILLILHLMVLANLYWVDSNFDFCSQYSVSLSALQPAITAPCLFSSFFFDLCSTSTLCLPQPLKSSNRPGNRCPWAIIITLIFSGNQKRRIDYVDVRYFSQRSFVVTKNCFAIVLSEQ